MQQLNEFLEHVGYQPLFNTGIAAAGLTACLIVAIFLLHTLHLMGRQTPLYHKKRPVEGWNKRFYPVSSFMVISLLVLMWLLGVWKHAVVAGK